MSKDIRDTWAHKINFKIMLNLDIFLWSTLSGIPKYFSKLVKYLGENSK